MQTKPLSPQPGEAAAQPTISPKINFADLTLPTTMRKGLPEAIREELLRDNQEYWAQEDVARGLFLFRPVNKWIAESKNEPIPKMLFSEFWHEGELCILFSDTNLGKSVLAIQIGDSISRGRPIPGFKMEAGAQKVMYFDFEMSKKQLEVRYAVDYKEHFEFHPDFYRAVIDPDFDLPEDAAGYEQYLAESRSRAW